jgi:GGDEF domain-containing protein
VADAPIDALLLRAEDLTKGWLLALLEQAPLEAAPAILAADMTREGPRVCDAVVRALADEADLRRLEQGGALEPLVSRTGELAGSLGAEATARAVDTLQAVMWSALRSELPGAGADQISELAERLAYVMELVRAAALRRADSVVVQDTRREASLRAAPRVREPTPEAEEPVREPPRPAVVPWPPEPETEPRPADVLWVGAVEDEVRRSEQSGSPLALLLIELDESERVSVVESPAEARTTFGRFAQSVRSVVRRHDILACETETRAWVIARDTARSGAHALASRIAGAVLGAPPWRGAPLTVSVGVAILGEDGRDAASLIEAAEEAKFAAAANGLSVMPEPPRNADDQPAG